MNRKQLIEENKVKFKDEIIYDGIVNETEYDASPVKVLWILKEANSPDDADWDMRDAIADLKDPSGSGIKKGWGSTFLPIVYATYGIFYNESWHKMSNVYKKQEMIDVLKKVAYINVKKIPGSSVSDRSVIKSYYTENKQALHEQVKLINPEIIIFGNTYSFFDADFFEMFGNPEEVSVENAIKVFQNENYLLIDTYHPNNRVMTQEKYCDVIIDAAHHWKEKYHKPF